MPSKTQSIIIGGLVAGILSTSYLGFINMLCCAGVIVGAVVGVMHYGRTYDLAVPAKDGVIMGILIAIFGAILSGILNYVLALAGIRADQVVQQFVLDSFSSNMSPDQIDEIERQMNRPVSLGMFFGLQFIFGLFLVSLFGAAGGAIGAAITRKNAPSTPAI